MRRTAMVLCAFLSGACADESSGDEPSVLEGIVQYEGELPDLAAVTYTALDGEELIASPVYEGWVTTFVDPSTSITDVEAASGNGTVVNAIPAVGYYTIDVGAGAEPDAIQDLLAEPFVEDALPTGVVLPEALAVVDNGFGGEGFTDCKQQHGKSVAHVAGRSGGDIRTVDVGLGLYEAVPQLILGFAGRIALEAARQGFQSEERIVINVSMGVCGETPHVLEVIGEAFRPGWCARNEKAFLSTIARIIQTSFESSRDNLVFVSSSGNRGQDLTAEYDQVAADYPAGFSHMRMVGDAGDPERAKNGEAPWSTYAARHMVFAPSNNITVGSLQCSGTSFAAPEVARSIEEVWRVVPTLKSLEILEAFDASLDDGVLPTDRFSQMRTREFRDEFLDRACQVAGAQAESIPECGGTLTPANYPANPTTIPACPEDYPGWSRWTDPDTGMLVEGAQTWPLVEQTPVIPLQEPDVFGNIPDYREWSTTCSYDCMDCGNGNGRKDVELTWTPYDPTRYGIELPLEYKNSCAFPPNDAIRESIGPFYSFTHIANVRENGVMVSDAEYAARDPYLDEIIGELEKHAATCPG